MWDALVKEHYIVALRIFDVALARMFYHIEFFFVCAKHLDGNEIFCHCCQQEVGCNTDMLLVPPRRQLPVNWNDYVFDGVVLLDFLK